MSSDTKTKKPSKPRKSTGGPLGRLISNFEKIVKSAGLTGKKVSDWLLLDVKNADLKALSASIGTIAAEAEKANACVASLKTASWQPPKPSTAVHYKVGDKVTIAEAHRKRYLSIYDAATLDSLAVVRVLDDDKGQGKKQMLAVQSGNKSPFMVTKSHITRRD